jgi:hypothetical protein
LLLLLLLVLLLLLLLLLLRLLLLLYSSCAPAARTSIQAGPGALAADAPREEPCQRPAPLLPPRRLRGALLSPVPKDATARFGCLAAGAPAAAAAH